MLPRELRKRREESDMHLLVLIFALVTARPEVPGPHELFGVIRQVMPNAIVIARRNGQLLSIDITYARSVGRTGVLYVRRPVGVYGAIDRTTGRFKANAITSANGIERGIWPPDL